MSEYHIVNINENIRWGHAREGGGIVVYLYPISLKEIYAVILIGGVGLERGYTVKGLTVSYLSRNVGGKQQDTLLQRARFFGYHIEYQKFIQIYLSENLQKYFQQISQINNNFLISFIWC